MFSVAGLDLGFHILGRGISLLNVTVDEGGNGSSRRVDLVLCLGDGELGEKLLKNLDGLVYMSANVIDGRQRAQVPSWS
jgi:hypothetical protein